MCVFAYSVPQQKLKVVLSYCIHTMYSHIMYAHIMVQIQTFFSPTTPTSCA